MLNTEQANNSMSAIVYGMQKARSILRESFANEATDWLFSEDADTLLEMWGMSKDFTAMDVMNAIIYLKFNGADAVRITALSYDSSIADLWDSPTLALTINL